MARILKPTETVSSKEQVEELFAKSVTAVEALQGALDDTATSLHEAKATATSLLVQLIDRFLLHGALDRHLADANARLGEGRDAMGRADVPKVVQAGRQACANVDRLGEVIALLGKLTSADHDTSNTDCERYHSEFGGLLANEYRAFASRDNYPDEADAHAKLQGVSARLGELRLAPRLANRNICAVAGGFSSGKSSFLNALIGKDILPTETTSTTSIPTYIFHVDDALTANAFNHYGGGVEIKIEEFQQMTHDFKKKHGIELKRLVHRVSIYTPDLSQWANLALIDTPGYSNLEASASAGAADTEDRDEDIALANVLKSHFLIWVVEIEKGTLPEQDIQFIRKFVDAQPEDAKDRLYLVFNKGDKKGEQDRKEILQVAANTAESHAIPFAGIGIYSSHKREWYAHQGSSFDAFLQTVDQAQSSSTSELENDVQAIFQGYIDYHEQEAKQLGNAFGLLNRLSAAFPKDDGVSVDKLAADLTERRNYVRKAQREHENLREDAQQLQRHFAAAVRGFVEGIGTAASCR